MDVFKLEKPKISGKFDKVIRLLEQGENIIDYVKGVNSPEYLYWDKVRYRPRPEALTAEEFWALVKLLRAGGAQTAVRDTDGGYFTWNSPPRLDYFLHQVDMQLGGILQSGDTADEGTRRRFITRGIMEEAIASSQLEGANTTRKAAKRMLLEKKEPSNRSEKMIFNNYETMIAVEETLKNKKLTQEMLFALHAMLVDGTIASNEVGRFRREDDEILVQDAATNMIYHVPPPVSFLRKEFKRLVEYANDETNQRQFVHPLIKATILHFWMGYLHPFTDGNGRLARTVFYWYLLRHGYWAFTYLPLSRTIKNSPTQYRNAYIYSEQDDNDLTYFIDYIVRKVSQAMREFENHRKRKAAENRKVTRIARQKYGLNDRQIQLLRYVHKDLGATTSIKTHANVYNVSRMTARKDLEELEALGFLESEKVGRDRPFRATDKTAELFS